MTLPPIPLRHAASIHAEDMIKLQKAARGTMLNTLSAYNTLATRMEIVLGREPLTSDLDHEALEDYFREVISAQSDGTYQTRRAQHKVIVGWLMDRGYLPWGPNFADRIPKRRKDQVTTRKRRLSDDEFLKFLAAAKRTHVRDYYLSLFMRLSGRRSSEVLGHSQVQLSPLVWGDVRWDENVIIWNNHKARKFGLRMPLTPRLRAVLEAWRAAYCENVGVADVRNDWILFPALTAVGPTATGRRRVRILAPGCIFTNPYRAFREIMTKAGLGHQPGDGWHVIRKTYGNQRKRAAVETGRADAAELTKNALGHASEATQRIYLDEDEEYDRYAAWAMKTPELSSEAMAKIPELSSLIPSARPETTKRAPAVADAGRVEEVYTAGQEMATVIPLTSRRRRAALG